MSFFAVEFCYPLEVFPTVDRWDSYWLNSQTNGMSRAQFLQEKVLFLWKKYSYSEWGSMLPELFLFSLTDVFTPNIWLASYCCDNIPFSLSFLIS